MHHHSLFLIRSTGGSPNDFFDEKRVKVIVSKNDANRNHPCVSVRRRKQVETVHHVRTRTMRMHNAGLHPSPAHPREEQTSHVQPAKTAFFASYFLF